MQECGVEEESGVGNRIILLSLETKTDFRKRISMNCGKEVWGLGRAST